MEWQGNHLSGTCFGMPGTNKNHSWYMCISQNVFQTVPETLLFTPHHRPQNTFFLFCLTIFRSFPLLPFTSLIYCTYICFTYTANMQNLGHSLPPLTQNSFGRGEAQIQLPRDCSPLTSPLNCHCAVWQSSLIPVSMWDLPSTYQV